MKSKISLYFFGLFLLALAFVCLPKEEIKIEQPLTQEYVVKKEPKLARIMDRFAQEYLMTHDPKTKMIPRDRLYEGYLIAQAKSLQKDNILPIFWEERGPTNVGGRTRGILIDANDPSGQTVWAGGVAGGLWKTTNIDAGSPTWTNLDDLLENLAVSTIAQDPTNPDNIYFGTGECWGNIDLVLGLGFWSSNDGGDTWQRMPAVSGGSNPCINKIVVDNTGTLFAATTWGLRRFNPMTNTWPKVLGSGVFGVNDFIADVEIAANGDMYASSSFDKVYQSTDGGVTWNPLTSNGLPSSGYGRIELATAPSNGNVAYVLYADTTAANASNCASIYRTTNGGANWSPMTCPGNFGGQAWYNLILAVDPNNANRLWAGGVGLAYSTDGGATWNGANDGHPDHHAVVYRNGNSDEIIFGNDGGVYRTTNGSNNPPNFSDKNTGYNVTQFYAVALHPDAGSNYMLGGTQDNATPKFTNPGLSTTTCVLCCCDGGWAFIDEDDPSIQIGSTQDGSFNVSTDGGGSFSNILPGSKPRLFITPADYDDDLDVLYVSDSTDTFVRITDIGGANTVTVETVTEFGGSNVSALLMSPNIGNRIFMGTTNGTLVRIDNADQNGAVTVTDLNAPGTTYMSSIAVEFGNDNHIMVTYSNYGVVSIWETENGGDNWSNVEGDFPDLPVRWALFHPFDARQAIIATELGVWTTYELDGMNTTWFPTNNFGLANTRVDMLQYRSSDHVVAAATHGRGMYTTDYFDLLADCPDNIDLPGMIAPGIYIAKDLITSNGTVADGRKVIYQSGEEIYLTANFTAELGSDFWGLILPCDTDKGGSSANQETQSLVDVFFEESGDLAETEYSNLPEKESLKVYPNPSSFEATVEFALTDYKKVQILVFDARGKLVEELMNDYRDGGQHQIQWNASNRESGLYLIQIRTAGSALTEKVFVVR